MAKKTEEKKKTPDEMSLEECGVQIEEDRGKAKRAFFLAGVALITIVALGIAWFVSNHLVSGDSSTVSAQSDVPFELASVGSRQKAELEKLLDADGKNNILSDGNAKTYESYIDTDTWKKQETPQTYYVGQSSLAWHLKDQESVYPGIGGKLEFYLIPKKEGLHEVTVQMSLSGYTQGTDGKAEKIDSTKNPLLQRLIEGHILLFQNQDDEIGYSGWLGTTNSFTIAAPENQTFEKEMPYKVTLYWKWPQYFRNYVYTQRSTQGDLFTDKTSQADGSDYQKLIKFVNDQRAFDSSKLFYDADKKSSTGISETISNKMSDAVLDECSDYYNQADEYIGKTAKYIYMEMKVRQ